MDHHGTIIDVTIVGGGVIGCAIARELMRFRLRTVLVEAETEVGFDPRPLGGGRFGRLRRHRGLRTGHEVVDLDLVAGELDVDAGPESAGESDIAVRVDGR